MLHVVADGVPGGTEVAGFALRMIGDDVDTRNAGFVDWTVVIGDGATIGLGEETAIACC